MLDSQNTGNPDHGQAGDALLIVEDDQVFRDRLTKAMTRFGFAPKSVGSVEDALAALEDAPPKYAIVDLRLEDGNGLDVVDRLREIDPAARPMILTGYGNLPTAVAAVKAGAVDYLAKPVTAEEIAGVLRSKPGERPRPPANPVDPNDVKAIHIMDVYMKCDENMSETSRKLKMHRRTLQRIIKRIRNRH